jgi:flagella basal body P-ring formation protein FlgA
MRRLRIVLVALAVLSAPLPALAAAVDLRSDIFTTNGRVTLGDLFDGAGGAASAVVAQGQPGQNVVLDASRVQTFAHLRGLDWDNDRGIRRIIVQAGAAADAPAPAAANAKRGRAVQTLTFVHNLEAGEIVQAQDLSWSRTVDTPLDAPSDPDAVIGMAARRPMREGTAVSMHDVVAPQVIKKDDIISVVFNQGGIALTLQAKALENATPGQPFSVMNVTSKKIIQAVATGPGQAVVGPAADQLKATARTSLSRLALR